MVHGARYRTAFDAGPCRKVRRAYDGSPGFTTVGPAQFEGAKGRFGLMELAEELLDRRALRGGRRQPRQKRPRFGDRIGSAAALRVRDGEVEARLMKIRIGRE